MLATTNAPRLSSSVVFQVSGDVEGHLPCRLKGRKSGPVFVTRRKAAGAVARG
jgi:hypothetical protein